MRIIIDGYNLIRRIPELAGFEQVDLERGRKYLIQELSSYRAGKGHRVTVVFDGAGSIHLGGEREKERGITVIFSRQGRSADDVIANVCRDGGTDLVVTGDRDLRDRADRAGVPSVDPERFWERVDEERMRSLKGLEPEDEDDDKPVYRPGKKLSKKARKARS
ncbi:hypothetical protein EP232_02395, partial [bacterium]